MSYFLYDSVSAAHTLPKITGKLIMSRLNPMPGCSGFVDEALMIGRSWFGFQQTVEECLASAEWIDAVVNQCIHAGLEKCLKAQFERVRY